MALPSQNTIFQVSYRCCCDIHGLGLQPSSGKGLHRLLLSGSRASSWQI